MDKKQNDNGCQWNGDNYGTTNKTLDISSINSILCAALVVFIFIAF